MQAIINVGLLLSRIRQKNLKGFSAAAADCRTSPKNFEKLLRGELPRLDALQRICRGLNITEEDLIAMPRPKPEEPAKVIELKKSV